MIADIFLGLITLATIGAFCFYVWNDRKEHAKFNNALKSKNAAELRDLDFVDKVQIPKIEEQEPDFVPEEQLTDEKWKETITNG